MAKLTVQEPQTNIQESATPQSSVLGLPMSLAAERGKAISSVLKVVGAIQQDLNKIEDENQYNEVMPGIISEITKKFSEISSSSNIIDGPKEFKKALDYKNYAETLRPYNKNVQRLVRNELGSQSITLMPKLINEISSHVVDKALINIDKKWNDALLNATSNDAALIGKGSIDIDVLKNNKAYENLVGAKAWNAYVNKKDLQLVDLQINKQINLNPTSLIKNKEALIAMVGTDKAEEYLEEARTALLSKTTNEKRQNILKEVADNETKMGAFVELIERVNRAKDDPSLENEVPTIADLYDAMDNGMINQVMFNQLVGIVKGDEKLTDEQLYETITVAIYSADSIQKMDDIKKAILLDDNVLRSLDLKDITLFTAIVDRAKKDFPAHKDYKTYSKLIDANLKNLTNVNTPKFLKAAQELETRKVLIQRAYTQKVIDGMSPRNAYLSVLHNEMDINAVPKVKNVAPGFLRNTNMIDAMNKDPDFFASQNKVIYERFNGSVEDGEKVKGHGNIKKMQRELAELDFMEKLFQIRLNVAPGKTDLEKLTWALEGGSSGGLLIFDEKLN